LIAREPIGVVGLIAPWTDAGRAPWTSTTLPRQPVFGGYKQSGNGREYGK
jgi:acyl-CoA reductase-like NAD-dependent aldehyde dehydrogenase